MEDQISREIEIAAPVARVWRAVTEFREFSEWFRVKLDGPFVAGRPTGGHLTCPGHEQLRMEVSVQKIEPTSYFSFTWHPYAVDPNADYSQEEPTLVEFRLETTAVGTLLTVTESGFSKLPKERYADAFRMNSHGWEQQLHNVQAYVSQSA